MPQISDLTKHVNSRLLILIAILAPLGILRQFALVLGIMRDIPLPSPLGSISPELKVLPIWWFLMFSLSAGLVLGMIFGKIENTHNRVIYPFIYLMFLLLFVEF